ncbi:hypothetical protein GCM10011504_13640 [Siccirubricoccus deserti]|uniref:Uncharacterized protein n=1 Tax=Siccirubricoccus deserti TaxID=2013562 RepID=A0A9X0UCX1_9PROT|nr:hypothetical protein [Siccirubricoccus deserti]MBC4014981.1 hypothetical protein [Siccirubricoccus deserti]GGC36517.1 hypothetical protein GCM10011504_13640 [Siccirubricoccus deserti]
MPVFLSRGIRTPAELAGKTIGLPECQQTAALWVRGMLREHYGADTRRIAWRTGGERMPITLPPGFDVRPQGEGLPEALASGRVDALAATRPPACLLDGPAPVARLRPDTHAEEIAWHRATGFFPIMRCLAVRKDVAGRRPWLPVELHRAFCKARALSLAELQLTKVLRVSLPWIANAYAEQAAIMGGNPWPYGFARNCTEMEAMIRYAVADRMAAEALFHPSTLAEPT